jgi:hypothetical protein
MVFAGVSVTLGIGFGSLLQPKTKIKPVNKKIDLGAALLRRYKKYMKTAG